MIGFFLAIVGKLGRTFRRVNFSYPASKAWISDDRNVLSFLMSVCVCMYVCMLTT